MSEPFPNSVPPTGGLRQPFIPPIQPRPRRTLLHVGLFVLTAISTVLAGSGLVGRFAIYSLPGLMDGLRYAVPFLTFLTVHEFGHYFAAQKHDVDTTLPFYIPSPFSLIAVVFSIPLYGLFNIGTFGAVIKIRQVVPNLRKLFDIGIAGPLAGFVVALIFLIYAFVTLPPITYLLELPGHDVVKQLLDTQGYLPAQSPTPGTEYVGQTLLFWGLSQFFPNMPPMYEVYHYPVLFACWLAMFFTALNLMPIGQLDGGHIMFALVGPVWHGRIARAFMLLLLFSASVGFIDLIGRWLAYSYPTFGWSIAWGILMVVLAFFFRRLFDQNIKHIVPALILFVVLILGALWIGEAVTRYGYYGWFLWCLLVVFIIKVDHPPVLYSEPLTPVRRALGIISMCVFVACFSPTPIYTDGFETLYLEDSVSPRADAAMTDKPSANDENGIDP